MRYLSWIITLPLLLASLAFALENREDATLNFWPFDAALTLPLSLIVLGPLFAGLLLGGLLTWLFLLKHQIRACGLEREVKKLNEKLLALTPRLTRMDSELLPPSRPALRGRAPAP